MKIVRPSFEILFMPDGETVLKHIELAGRTCYKSHDKITPDSAAAFVSRILKSGHHSVIEHMSVTVRFTCDRGIMAELTRHRLASFSARSTRYVNYAKDKFGNEITVIQPFFWEEGSPAYEQWKTSMERAESDYLALIRMGATAQEARSVLPNSLKTEIVTTANLREWRHIFALRCDKAAHPQIREIMLPLLAEFHQRIPVVFDDLYEKFLTWRPPERKRQKFKYAYDKIGKGHGFVRIHQIREALSWSHEKFNEVFRKLLAEYVIEAHEGDLSILTEEQIQNSFKTDDIVFVTVSWRG